MKNHKLSNNFYFTLKAMTKFTILLFISFIFFSCASFDVGTFSEILARTDADTIEGTVGGVIKTGQAIGKAAEEFTPEQEYYLGRSVGAIILSQYKPYNKNQKLSDYVNNICWSLEVNNLNNRPLHGYHVQILDTQEINAFATTGGHIFVSKGIIDACKNEDQLAAIIAHEMSHIQLKHGTKAIKTDRWTDVGKEAFSTFAKSQTGDNELLEGLVSSFSDSISDISATLINSGYSRDTEKQADELALTILQNTGYNPEEMINSLKDLQNSGNYSSGGFTATHPSPEQRIKNLKKPLSKMKSVETYPERTARFKEIIGK